MICMPRNRFSFFENLVYFIAQADGKLFHWQTAVQNSDVKFFGDRAIEKFFLLEDIERLPMMARPPTCLAV